MNAESNGDCLSKILCWFCIDRVFLSQGILAHSGFKAQIVITMGHLVVHLPQCQEVFESTRSQVQLIIQMGGYARPQTLDDVPPTTQCVLPILSICSIMDTNFPSIACSCFCCGLTCTIFYKLHSLRDP